MILETMETRLRIIREATNILEIIATLQSPLLTETLVALLEQTLAMMPVCESDTS